MEQQNVVNIITQQLDVKLPLLIPRGLMCKWKDLAHRSENLNKEVAIALVGKYTKLEDAYASVKKALMHASLAVNYKLNLQYIEAADLEPKTKDTNPVLFHEAWQKLCKADGVLVPGGFGTRGIEGKLSAIEWARSNKKPFLGVCLGFQCAVVEFARNVLGHKEAGSTEINPECSKPLVIDMPEHNQGQMGGTMRLGKRETLFKDELSITFQLYQKQKVIEERHRHRYEVNPDYVQELEAKGMKFVGQDVTGKRMEIMELKGHPYFVGVQFHPEYISRPLKPSPPYLGLVLASCGKLSGFLNRNCKFSPRYASDEEFSDEGEFSSGFQSGTENLVDASLKETKEIPPIS